jgi:hypothetical protein
MEKQKSKIVLLVLGAAAAVMLLGKKCCKGRCGAGKESSTE